MGTTITLELLDKIDNYLKGDLSNEECMEFEKQMTTDSELSEMVEIQKRWFEIHDFKVVNSFSNATTNGAANHYKAQLNDPENQRLFSKIKEIGQQQQDKNTYTSKNYLKYYVAASVAILLSTLFYMNSNANLEKYYKDKVNWNELPSYVSKGDEAITDFTLAEQLFRNNELNKAITTFKKITVKNKLYPYALMYIGASYEQLNENEKAIETFDELSKRISFEEHSRGYWYKLILYLKTNDKDKAIEMKALILKDTNNFNYDQAKKLEL